MAIDKLGALLAAALIFSLPPAFAATQNEIDNAWKYGLWWLIKSQNGDGYWESQGDIKVITTALAVQALNRAPLRTLPFSKGVGWLSNANAGSVDALARQTLALSEAGLNPARYLDLLMTRRLRLDRGAWGAYDRFGVSFPDTPLALAASRTSTPPRLTDQEWIKGVCEIVVAQINPQAFSGTWSYFGATASLSSLVTLMSPAVLPTALNLLELNAFTSIFSFPSGLSCYGLNFPDDALKTTIPNAGVAWLAARQNSDGGFGVGGLSTVFETAHVYKALATLSPTAPAKLAAENYIVSKVLATQGGWGPGANGDSLVTALVLSVLPPPSAAVLLDSDGDGIPNVVEALMGKNPLVADAGFVQGGNTGAGLRNSYQFPVPLVRNLAFSFSPIAVGGKAPYAWRLSAGALPTGMTVLGTSGVISGKPTVAGNYSFAISMTDTAGASVTSTYDVVVSTFDGIAILQTINAILVDD